MFKTYEISNVDVLDLSDKVYRIFKIIGNEYFTISIENLKREMQKIKYKR